MELSKVLEQSEGDFKETLDKLIRLATEDSVSFDGFEREKVIECGKTVQTYLEELGLETKTLEQEGAFPCLFAKSKIDDSLPTVLLYAHYDVQPPMREEKWVSPPFKPTEREGRLYGRGCADDKAGIMVHWASIAAYLKSAEKLPVNVKCLFEGEEEIGSPNLASYIDSLGDDINADVVIIADVSNYDVGKPAIVNSLRGNVCLEVLLKSLKSPLHSGMWGGPIPDVSQGLSKLLASLSENDGSIAVAGLYDDITPLGGPEKESLQSLDYSIDELKEQSGFLENTQPINMDHHPLENIWRRPSISVTSMQSGDKQNAGNVIQDEAWARISMRIVPGMDSKKSADLLVEHLKKNIPWGMQLSIENLHFDPAWMCSADNEVFEIALASLSEGFGEKAVVIGCGGSIPLVSTIENFIGKVPILLTGIEDPYTQAHSENESLHLGDFKSAIKSQIILFEKLGKSLSKS